MPPAAPDGEATATGAVVTGVAGSFVSPTGAARVARVGGTLRALDCGSGNEDSTTLQSAALTMGLQQALPAVQRIGEVDGIIVVDDYAHHPTEIDATLQAARSAYPDRRIIAVFQPHLFSRTRDFAAEFGRALARVLREDATLHPLSPYGIDKLGGEHFLHYYSVVHGVPCTALRFFNVYGPRQDPRSPYSGVISLFIKALSNGTTPVIYGDGEQSRHDQPPDT